VLKKQKVLHTKSCWQRLSNVQVQRGEFIPYYIPILKNLTNHFRENNIIIAACRIELERESSH
jgi:hypothetical protein